MSRELVVYGIVDTHYEPRPTVVDASPNPASVEDWTSKPPYGRFKMRRFVEDRKSPPKMSALLAERDRLREHNAELVAALKLAERDLCAIFDTQPWATQTSGGRLSDVCTRSLEAIRGALARAVKP